MRQLLSAKTSRAKFLLKSLVLALCVITSACSSSGGGSPSPDDGGTVSYSHSDISTETIPAGSSSWINIPSIDTGGGVISEIVLDSDGPIYVRAFKTENALFFDYDPSSGTVTYTAGLPVNVWPYYVGVYLYQNKTAGLTIPAIHNAGGYPSGEYMLRVENPGAGDLAVRISLARKTDPDFSKGSLSINLFIYNPPVSGIKNSVIPDEAEAGNVKNYMSEIFSQIGVSVDNMTVAFVDDPEAHLLLTENDLIAFLEKAAKGTAGRTDTGVNCFLVPNLPLGILGMDGSIPGPAFIHGTTASGIIAQIRSYGFAAKGYSVHETDQRFLAKILAHEIGHYLGLFHTSESDGKTHDPMDDTPECSSSFDADGDGIVSGQECRSAGSEYLMFWTVDNGLVREGDFQTRMSPKEGDSANTHPSVL